MIPSVSTGPNSCFEAAIRAMSAHHISPYYLPSHDPTIRNAYVTRLCDDMTSSRGHFRHYMSLHWAVFVGQHGAPLMVTRSDGSRLEPFRGDTVTRETVCLGLKLVVLYSNAAETLIQTTYPADLNYNPWSILLCLP